MSYVNALKRITVGAGVGVAAIIALPFFGPVGMASALGKSVASCFGAMLGAVDAYRADEL